MKNNNLRFVVAAGLVLLSLCGCSTLEYVPINRSKPEELRTRLAVGESVNVRLQSGDQYQFRILALEADAIVGRDKRIAYKDIDLLEVKTVDYEGTAKTAAAVGALALVYIAAMVIEAELDEESDTSTHCDSNGVGGCIPR
jgi:hypothetical protein